MIIYQCCISQNSGDQTSTGSAQCSKKNTAIMSFYQIRSGMVETSVSPAASFFLSLLCIQVWVSNFHTLKQNSMYFTKIIIVSLTSILTYLAFQGTKNISLLQYLCMKCAQVPKSILIVYAFLKWLQTLFISAKLQWSNQDQVYYRKLNFLVLEKLHQPSHWYLWTREEEGFFAPWSHTILYIQIILSHYTSDRKSVV